MDDSYYHVYLFLGFFGQVIYTSLRPCSYTLRVTTSNDQGSACVWRRAQMLSAALTEVL